MNAPAIDHNMVSMVMASYGTGVTITSSLGCVFPALFSMQERLLTMQEHY